MLAVGGNVVAGLFIEGAGHGAFVVAFFNALALVEFFFAASDSYDKFGQTAVVDEQPQRHDGESGFLALLFKLAYFLAVARS